MKTLYHFTSVFHLKEIIERGSLTRTRSQLKPLLNPRVVEGNYTDDNADYKPVVWLTDSLSPDKMGIDEAPFPEHDKTRIRLEIPMLPELGILRWRTFADANDADPDCRKKIERGMNHHSWYVTEQEVPFSAVIGIYDYHKRQAIPMLITKDTLVSLLDNVSGIHCRDYKIYSVEDWLKDFVTG